MKYKVTFYQSGVTGIEPETYSTKLAASKAAAEFLQSFGELSRRHGLRYTGSVYRDGYARIMDRQGGTEALAEVSPTIAKD